MSEGEEVDDYIVEYNSDNGTDSILRNWNIIWTTLSIGAFLYALKKIFVLAFVSIAEISINKLYNIPFYGSKRLVGYTISSSSNIGMDLFVATFMFVLMATVVGIVICLIREWLLDRS